LDKGVYLKKWVKNYLILNEIFVPASGQTHRWRRNVLNMSIRSSVTKLVNTVFWIWMNQLCYQVAQVRGTGMK